MRTSVNIEGFILWLRWGHFSFHRQPFIFFMFFLLEFISFFVTFTSLFSVSITPVFYSQFVSSLSVASFFLSLFFCVLQILAFQFIFLSFFLKPQLLPLSPLQPFTSLCHSHSSSISPGIFPSISFSRHPFSFSFFFLFCISLHLLLPSVYTQLSVHPYTIFFLCLWTLFSPSFRYSFFCLWIFY